jgi:hypothetical protein
MPLASAARLDRSGEAKGLCPRIGLETILGVMLMSSVGITLPLHRYPALHRMVDG